MEAANVPSNEFGAVSPQTQASSVCLEKKLADDVDAAATAMLVLKHGANVFDIKPGTSSTTPPPRPHYRSSTLEPQNTFKSPKSWDLVDKIRIQEIYILKLQTANKICVQKIQFCRC